MKVLQSILYIFTIFWCVNTSSSAMDMLNQEPQFETKVALVTGASRGIGFSLVEQLIADKIKVIAVVRDKESLENLQQKHSAYLQCIEADLSSIEGILSIVKKIQDSKIDFLVHNAAIIEPLGQNAFFESSPENLLKIFYTNLIAPILLTNSLGTKLVKGSRILNISSRAAEAPYSGGGAYCTTKAGLDMFTKAFQVDHPHGVLCASVHPGEVDTGMQGNLRNHNSKEFPLSDNFHKLEKEGKLIPPEISGKYLKWLLLKTDDNYFEKEKHNIYDGTHQLKWNEKILQSPY